MSVYGYLERKVPGEGWARNIAIPLADMPTDPLITPGISRTRAGSSAHSGSDESERDLQKEKRPPQ